MKLGLAINEKKEKKLSKIKKELKEYQDKSNEAGRGKAGEVIDKYRITVKSRGRVQLIAETEKMIPE